MRSETAEIVLFRTRTGGLARRELIRFAERLRREVGRGQPFCGLITSDAELRELNLRFRGKNYPTDVLSFPSGRGKLGDIAISMDRAREQAREFGHTVSQELQILMLHGVLHLSGFDHQSDGGAMRRQEMRWRKRLGLPSGLIERMGA